MTEASAFSSNFFTARKNFALTNNSNNFAYGNAIVTYQIQRFHDVSNLGSRLGYLVTVMQRIIIPNQTAYTPGATSSTSYDNYPAILQSGITITTNNSPDIILRNVFPRTLNSQVSTVASQSSENGTSSSVQNTSGSNQNTINSYGVTLSAGLSATTPMFSRTTQYGQSFSSGTMQTASAGSSNSATQNLGASQSMSIKDWSSYAQIDPSGVNPNWLFGQSYPWDVLQYNQLNDSTTTIDLPDFVVAQLYSDGLVLPPSQLSQFGIDFTMTADWLLVYSDPITVDETVTFTHDFACFTASHSASKDTTDPITATLQGPSDAYSTTVSSPSLSLSIYGLTPLTASAVAQSTAIGFPTADWTIAPTSARGTCKVVSPGDTLQVEAIGFDADMSADFSAPLTQVTLTFKVPDHNLPYSLALMHWIGAGSGAATVAWSVNGKASGTLVVDAEQGEGAQGNASAIVLRNTDVSSMDLHDYLVVGTNTVTLTVTVADATDAAYTLHAIGLGLG